MKLVCAAVAISVASAANTHDETVSQPSVRGGFVSVAAGGSEAIDTTTTTTTTSPEAVGAIDSINDPSARQLQTTYCSCTTCTQVAWETYAGAYQCGARIEYKSSQWGGGLSHEDGKLQSTLCVG
jgi:hypothetical protein